jgi:HEAT repeat protein
MMNHSKKSQPDLPSLLNALKDKDRYARIAAVEALREIGNAAAVAGLIEAVADPDESVRWVAAGALGEIGDARAVLALLQALQAADTILQDIAAQSLGRIGSPAVDKLRATLNHPDKQVRRLVAQTLGEIGSPNATTDLVDALQDEDWQVRWAAVKALENIATPEALAVAHNWKRLR